MKYKVFKCIKKSKLNYTLIGIDGKEIDINSKYLREQIKSGRFIVTNLKVTEKGDKIIERTIGESSEYYRTYFKNAKTNISEKNDSINKVGVMLNVLPIVNDHGEMIGIPSTSKSIYITSRVKSILKKQYSQDCTFEFLYTPYILNTVGPEMISGEKIVIHTDGLMDYILNYRIVGNIIVINTDVNIKIIDTIFKIIRDSGFNTFRMEICTYNPNKINKCEAINKLERILEKQKENKNIAARCFNLTNCILLIYSISLTYKDAAIYNKYAKPCIDKLYNYYYEILQKGSLNMYDLIVKQRLKYIQDIKI